MILSGSTISNVNHARKMAAHLFKDENELVVQETINGGTEYKDFESSLISMQLMTRMTKGNTGIFHVAINPREDETLTPEQYDQAIEIIEQKFGFRNNDDGLTQPRVRIDHIKDGRAHSHVLWSLVDQDNEKLLKTSLYKRKLQECAINMEKEFNLAPVDRTPKETTMQLTHADRMNEARNKQKNIDRLKAIERKQEITDIWSRSEHGQAFLDNLKLSGYSMANGNKMTKVTVINENGEKEKVEVPVLVVVDQYGEARNIARELPRTVKAKDIREQLGDLVNQFLSVEEVRKVNVYEQSQENINRQNKDLDVADPLTKETSQKPKNPIKDKNTQTSEFIDKEQDNIKRINKELDAQDEHGKTQAKLPRKKKVEKTEKSLQSEFDLSKGDKKDKLEKSKLKPPKVTDDKNKLKERQKGLYAEAEYKSFADEFDEKIDFDRRVGGIRQAFEKSLDDDKDYRQLLKDIEDLKKRIAKTDTIIGRTLGSHKQHLNDLADKQKTLDNANWRREEQRQANEKKIEAMIAGRDAERKRQFELEQKARLESYKRDRKQSPPEPDNDNQRPNKDRLNDLER